MGAVLWFWGLTAVAARDSLVDELEHDLLHLHTERRLLLTAEGGSEGGRGGERDREREREREKIERDFGSGSAYLYWPK